MENPTYGWGALFAAIVSSVGWWYHIRKLERADKTGGDVTKSLTFILEALRAEIARQSIELTELRLRAKALETENAQQRREMDVLQECQAGRA